ncbi:amidase [Neisseria leonii]|uniref:amidase n=1 Tax=Neisseria leonii TaxID=2995413 RepID=UPI0030CADCE2
MKFEEYRRYDAVGLADLVRRGEVSADELLQTALRRLDEVNPKLNLLACDLRGRAAALPVPGNAPLAGVPFLLKDLLADWAGAPTACGSRMMQNHIPPYSSALTEAYLRAGLRIFGKTTLPEWGLMPYTESEMYGATRNPWHTDYTPGGSSGGSAAAVAAGIVPAAHGGDGGGSIRLPAHNCGLFGLKPSRGRSSFAPALGESWQGLVCEHVLTRSVRDSALFLDIAASTQKGALYACPKPSESFSDGILRETGRLNIAYWQEPWTGGGNDEGTCAALADSLQLLASAGHVLTEESPEFAPPEILSRAMLIIVAGETAKLAHLYRETYGKDLHYSQVEPATWAVLVQGRQISAGEMCWARDVLLAQTRAAEAFFNRYDVLVTPVCPRTTPKVGELAPGAAQQRLSRLLLGRLNLGRFLARNPLIEQEGMKALHYAGYTLPFNMSGSPAMSVPLYWHNGLPVGTQFAAAAGREDILLRLAAQLEQIRPWADKTAPL